MKLYYSPGACSLAPHIVLRELGFNFELVKVDLRAKQYAGGEDFTKINPKGSVPTLELDNGECLTEGAVILQYLADQKPDGGLSPAHGTMSHYRMLEWLNYVATDLHKGFSPLFGAEGMVANAEGREQLKVSARKNLQRRYATPAKTLEMQPFLLGDKPSLPDFYLFTISRWARAVEVDLSAYSSIHDFIERVRARPAVAEALKIELGK